MTDSAVAPQASDQYVQSLARGLAVIRAFDANNPVMTLSEVAARTDLTRATARRFLYTLVELGYVRTNGKTFALTAKVLQLGYSYLSALSLPQLEELLAYEREHANRPSFVGMLTRRINNVRQAEGSADSE